MIVVDTHVLVWWLGSCGKLSRKARRLLASASTPSSLVASAISLLEIATAVRRGRLELAVPVERWLNDARSLPELKFEPVSAEIAQLAGSFGETLHGDPADRLIVATALLLGAPLATADSKLQAWPGIETVW